MPCIDYVESHLSKVSSDSLSDSDLMNMLGGGGGCQVDVVLYLISHSKNCICRRTDKMSNNKQKA
jgi:hypothetical protein